MQKELALLSTEQVCTRYGISGRTLSRLTQQGKIPKPIVRKQKNGYSANYWPAIDLDLWLAEKEQRKPLPLESGQAERIIDAFGGVQRLAKLMEVSDSVIYRWRLPKGPSHGGTGGYVPNHNWPLIRTVAREQKVHLTPKLMCP